MPPSSSWELERGLPSDPLCWFCGEAASKPYASNAVGCVVFSCDIFVSHNRDLSREETEGERVHVFNDCARICDRCVKYYHSQCADLDPTYLAHHREHAKRLYGDIANFETGLVSFEERAKDYPESEFGCWFHRYPWKGLRRRFRGLPLQHLFERGLRFKGEIVFDEPELSHFLDRFSSDDVPRWEVTDGFRWHVRRVFGVLDPKKQERFAAVRTEIADVTLADITERSGSVDENEE
ncbi:hypothetical protein Pan216_03480 [Planctomycetes bacterium Pan216]|uniref:Uncharacterized protein n=1 Tax=Kolteria novifilia TaxID=2527975 RepID=A0A518AXQ8_9BACT|nr:hypothetical protein Pan216_03480 [Planctomycetes bacterium Pan216]